MIFSWFKQYVKRLLNSNGYILERIDPLTILANKTGSDKGTMSYGHQYTRIYTKLFEPFREKKIVLLEMGLLRVEDDKRRSSNGAEGGATMRSVSKLLLWRCGGSSFHVPVFMVLI